MRARNAVETAFRALFLLSISKSGTVRGLCMKIRSFCDWRRSSGFLRCITNKWWAGNIIPCGMSSLERKPCGFLRCFTKNWWAGNIIPCGMSSLERKPCGFLRCFTKNWWAGNIIPCGMSSLERKPCGFLRCFTKNWWEKDGKNPGRQAVHLYGILSSEKTERL